MLQLRVQETWRHIEPTILVGLILRGKVGKRTTARDASQSNREHALEELLGTEHFKLLSQRLLAEVHAAFKNDVDEESLGLDLLERRVSDLQKWKLARGPSKLLRLRMAWLWAWLAELLDREADAAKRYDHFIQQFAKLIASEGGESERALLLLATTNRAVLLLRQGDMTHLGDLVEAALREILPGACLSLVNIINRAWNRGVFLAIADVIADCLAGLPPPMLDLWLPLTVGPSGPPTQKQAAAGEHAAAGERTVADIKKSVLEALNDRRNRLGFVWKLMEIAAHVTDEKVREADGELHLWPTDPRHLVVAPHEGPATTLRSFQRHGPYAEAVSLLFDRDICEILASPSSPDRRTDARLAKLIRWAEAAHRRGDLIGCRRRIAQAKVLLGSAAEADKQALGMALDKLVQQLQNGAPHNRRREYFALLRELEQEIREICAERDLSQTRLRASLLEGRFERLRWLQGELGLATGGFDPLADFRKVIETHCGKLRDSDHRRDFEAAWDGLQRLLPQKISEPVDPEAYEQLQVCRALADDESRTTCDTLYQTLKRHDARHLYGKALERLRRPRAIGDREEIVNWLKESVQFDLGLASHIAPLVGLLYLTPVGAAPGATPEVAEALFTHAEKIIQLLGEGGAAALQGPARQALFAGAVADFRRTCGELVKHGGRRAQWKMSRALGKVFRPVIYSDDVAAIASVEGMLHDWAAVCEDRADPRHPCQELARQVLAAKQLAQARELLTSDSPAQESVERRKETKGLIAAALESGLRSKQQILGATWTCALANPLSGPQPQQARALRQTLHTAAGVLKLRPGETKADWHRRTAQLRLADIQSWIDAAEQAAAEQAADEPPPAPQANDGPDQSPPEFAVADGQALSLVPAPAPNQEP